MIASLNQSSSLSSLAAALMSVITSMARPSREAAEQQGGILLLIDAQTDAAPLEDVPFAGDQIFNDFDAAARSRWADLDIAEMKPELARSGLCQRHGDGHGVIACFRFLYETDDLAVVDLREAQIVGLQERRIVSPYAVEARDVAFDIAEPVPVAHLQFILLGIKVFLLSGYRFVLQQLETVVDAVIARQRGGKRHPRLEDPGLAALQVERQDIGRIDEEVGTEIFALGITGDLAQVGLQFLLARAPSEVGVGLAEAELGERLHHLRSGEGLGQKHDVRIDGLDFSDQPLPERERLGMRVVDAKDAHSLRDQNSTTSRSAFQSPSLSGPYRSGLTMSSYFFGGFSEYWIEPSGLRLNHSGCCASQGWSGEHCTAKSSATSNPCSAQARTKRRKSSSVPSPGCTASWPPSAEPMA